MKREANVGGGAAVTEAIQLREDNDGARGNGHGLGSGPALSKCSRFMHRVHFFILQFSLSKVLIY